MEVLEEPWSDNIENLIIKWKIQCVDQSNIHEISGYKIKSNHNVFGLPPIIIPLVMTYLSQLMGENTKITGLMFLLSGLSGAIYKWLNLGEKYTLHFQYATKYQDIIFKINSELARDRKFRRPADVFITEIMSSMNHLNQSAPDIPTCLFSLTSCKTSQVQRNKGPEITKSYIVNSSSSQNLNELNNNNNKREEIV